MLRLFKKHISEYPIYKQMSAKDRILIKLIEDNLHKKCGEDYKQFIQKYHKKAVEKISYFLNPNYSRIYTDPLGRNPNTDTYSDFEYQFLKDIYENYNKKPIILLYIEYNSSDDKLFIYQKDLELNTTNVLIELPYLPIIKNICNTRAIRNTEYSLDTLLNDNEFYIQRKYFQIMY